MGLTNLQMKLIEKIVARDPQEIKTAALACVIEDTTQKNHWFCKKYKSILESSGGNFAELPVDLRNLLYVEDVATSFKENRYFLSSREAAVFKNIQRMDRVNKKLMELEIPYLNATLLHGRSGTGKTTFGRYLAKKMNLPFCYLNFSNLIDSYIGKTSKNICKAFTYARETPCVFMLDEIDCISLSRGSGSASGAEGEMNRVTITLMQEIDMLSNDTILLAATNRIDCIDKAVLRRFSILHEVVPLSIEENMQLIEKYLADIHIELPSDIKETIAKKESQSELLKCLVRAIANKIEASV